MSSEHLQAEAIADNLDAAVESALAQLNSTRSEAEIEVLQRPSHGLLGVFGKRPARVVVRLHDRAAIARQVTPRAAARFSASTTFSPLPSASQM